MNNRTYSDLYSLISSLSGVSNFTTSEQANILNFVNRRLYNAYRQSETWPRYIVGTQARFADNNLISFTYSPASNTITSASRNGNTVSVVCNAAVDFSGGMRVTVSGLSGSVNPNGNYEVVSVSTTTVANDTFSYLLASGTGTENYVGSGAALADSLSSIGSFLRIWGSNPLNLNSAIEYEFWVDSDGAHVINNYDGQNGFWVSYFKDWPGPYTDSSTDIPLEFFYYTAHGAYADFLRMDGQIDKAIAEENNAQQYLLIELDKVQNARNNNSIYRRIQTYTSRQSR